jgi:predicted deacylase
MTTTYIKEQVRTIEKATQNASKSKETALRFLKDAGILNSPTAKTNKSKDKK